MAVAARPRLPPARGSTGTRFLVMYMCGGVAAAVLGLTPEWPSRYPLLDVGLGVGALVVAGALWPARRRLPVPVQHGLLLLGSVAVAAGVVAVAGTPATAVAATFFVWPVVFAFASFPVRAAAVHTAATAALYLGALAWSWERALLLQWAVVLGVFLVVAVVVRSLVVQLDHQATHDPLTGLANRRRLFAQLAREVGRAERHGLPLSVAVLDLDGFKAVNDRDGHAAGDAVLVAVARRLRGSVRPHDLVARLGGDEFALVLVHADAAVAADVVARVTAVVAPACAVTPGVATWVPGTGADDLVRAADAVLYARKRRR